MRPLVLIHCAILTRKKDTASSAQKSTSKTYTGDLHNEKDWDVITQEEIEEAKESGFHGTSYGGHDDNERLQPGESSSSGHEDNERSQPQPHEHSSSGHFDIKLGPGKYTWTPFSVDWSTSQTYRSSDAIQQNDERDE